MNHSTSDRLLKGHNFFGDPVYSPLAVFAESDGAAALCALVRQQLGPALGLYGIEFTKVQMAIRRALENLPRAPRALDLVDAEHEVEEVLRNGLCLPRQGDIRSRSLVPRARKCAAQVQAALARTGLLDRWQGRQLTVADVGCGDGLVAKSLREVMSGQLGRVYLADVKDYRDVDVEDGTTYPFILLPDDYDSLTLPHNIDLILLSTVLHHSAVPSSVLHACWKLVAKHPDRLGAIVVIESCIDIDETTLRSDLPRLAVDEPNRGHTSAGLLADPAVKSFLDLRGDCDQDGQRRYTTFIDWFYNRVLHKGVYVPCNFSTPSVWNDLFESLAEVSVQATYVEGFDQPIAPEFHTIHVLTCEGSRR
jgi:hypothetical protein